MGHNARKGEFPNAKEQSSVPPSIFPGLKQTTTPNGEVPLSGISEPDRATHDDTAMDTKLTLQPFENLMSHAPMSGSLFDPFLFKRVEEGSVPKVDLSYSFPAAAQSLTSDLSSCLLDKQAEGLLRTNLLLSLSKENHSPNSTKHRHGKASGSRSDRTEVPHLETPNLGLTQLSQDPAIPPSVDNIGNMGSPCDVPHGTPLVKAVPLCPRNTLLLSGESEDGGIIFAIEYLRFSL